MKTKRFVNKNVVITGGSSGIGLEVAVKFARLGANLFLIARNEQRLQDAVKTIRARAGEAVAVTPFPCDVGDRSRIEEVIHTIGKSGGIHTLINNAGVLGVSGTLENTSIQELEDTMRINYFGMLYPTKAAWEYLKQSGDGHIGFVSSVAGYLGMFGYASYSPTKFAVTGLAECVRMEAKDHNVGVTIVFPPDTETPMLEYERAHTIPECAALSKHAAVMSAEAVAERFMRGIVGRRFEVLCNFESSYIRLIKTVWPGLYFRIIDGIIAKDRKQRGVRG